MEAWIDGDKRGFQRVKPPGVLGLVHILRGLEQRLQFLAISKQQIPQGDVCRPIPSSDLFKQLRGTPARELVLDRPEYLSESLHVRSIEIPQRFTGAVLRRKEIEPSTKPRPERLEGELRYGVSVLGEVWE